MNASTAIPPGSASPMTAPPRRRELDVIGMVVVLSLVFLHTVGIFSGFQMIVNDRATQSMLTTTLSALVISFFTLWEMPLLMFIAGYTIRYSLLRRSVGQFLRDRVRRLLVPFLAGLVLIMPPMVYFALKSWFPEYQESFLQFYPRFWNVRFSLSAFPVFFKGTPQVWAGSEPVRAFDISHLWFVLYLFVYTLLLLPVFAYLRQPRGQRLVERLGAVFSRPWTIWLLALPIAVIEGVLATDWPGAWSRFVWPFFILLGFVFSGEQRLEDALERYRKSALLLAINGFLLYFGALGILMNVLQIDPFSSRTLPGILARFVKGFAGWFWIVAVLGYAAHRSRRWVEPAGKPTWIDRFAAYAREGQLPFYVLHQLPIIWIGYYVVQWNVHALVKLLVICLASYLVTFVLYEIVVRRTSITRFLFGMKPAKGG